MTNKQIISALKREKTLDKEGKEISKEIKRLQKRLGAIEDIFHNINKVDEIYEGIALFISDIDSDWCDFRGVGDDYNRGAQIYINAHNNKTWGLHFRNWDKRLGETGRETWGGCNWPTKEEAIIACKRWILYREIQMR